MDIIKMTALEIGRAIKNKDITSPEVTERFFEQIELKDEKINAFVTLCKKEAMRASEKVQERINGGEYISPLAGVPIAIKDNISTEGVQTTCSSKMLSGYVPPYTATAVKNLEKAGMIVVGKTNMDEFAMGSTTETSFFGATHNPYDTNKVPGGSSGGSAAAVSASMIPCALGSDTGGSIRQPASYCGVTGLKPTYGTVSRYGLIAYASSLDQIGPIAKDALDCAAITDIIKGKDYLDGTSLELESASYLNNISTDIRGMKIAVPRECFTGGIQDEVRKAVLDCAKTLEGLGAVIKEVSLPFYDYAIPSYYIIATAEASSNLSRFDGVKYGYSADSPINLNDLLKRTRSEGFGEEVKKRIMLGTFVLSSGYYDAYYKKALQVKAIVKNEFDKVFADYSAIICPTAPTTAPVIGESLKDTMKMYLSDIYTVPVNIAGLPGISLPCGFDAKGMPIGAQLLGQRLSEQTLFNISAAYQSVTEYHKKAAEVR